MAASLSNSRLAPHQQDLSEDHFSLLGEADGLPPRYKTILALATATYGNGAKHVDPVTPPTRLSKDDRATFVGALILLFGVMYAFNAVMKAESATEGDKAFAKQLASQACAAEGKTLNTISGQCY